MRKDKMKPIKILSSGNGSWLISITLNKKLLSTITTNAKAVEDYKSNDDERCEVDGRIVKKKRGYTALHKELVAAHDNQKTYKLISK